MPIPRPDLRLLFFLSPKKFGLRWATVSTKILTDEKSDNKKTKKKKRQVRSSQCHIEDLCIISRSESKNRRGHSPRKIFVFFYANQPVYHLPAGEKKVCTDVHGVGRHGTARVDACCQSVAQKQKRRIHTYNYKPASRRDQSSSGLRGVKNAVQLSKHRMHHVQTEQVVADGGSQNLTCLELRLTVDKVISRKHTRDMIGHVSGCNR